MRKTKTLRHAAGFAEGATQMTHTSIPAFSQAAEQAQHWVNELARELDWNQPRAYRLLRAVLRTLRDWLQPEEAADLSAQLPPLIRGIFFEGWNPAKSPSWVRTKDDFVAIVEDELADDRINNPDAAIAAVFGLIDRHISQGEAEDVRNSLRKGLRHLWPAH